MTILNEDNRIQYTGNDIATIFSTGLIVFYDSSDLIVTETLISTNADTVLVNGTGYTVSGGNGSTGSITLPSALPSTKRLTISRALPYTQPDDFIEGENILAETIETRFDKITILTQQIKDEADRSIKLPVTTTASSITLPNYSVDKVLGWSDVTADLIVNSTKTLNDIEGAVDAVAALAAASGVKVSANDTTVGFLNGKLIAGTNLIFTENNDGANETMTIDATRTTNETNAVNLTLHNLK